MKGAEEMVVENGWGSLGVGPGVGGPLGAVIDDVTRERPCRGVCQRAWDERGQGGVWVCWR